jgi:hypothetical protein
MMLAGWHECPAPCIDAMAHSVGSSHPARTMNYKEQLVETCGVTADDTAWLDVYDICVTLAAAVCNIACPRAGACIRLNWIRLVFAEPDETNGHGERVGSELGL